MPFRKRLKKCTTKKTNTTDDKLESPNVNIRDPLALKCPFCPRECRGKAKLKIHLRVHTGEKPYVCTECPKRFSHKGNLTTHSLRMHGNQNKVEGQTKLQFDSGDNDKPYICPVCQKGFNHKRNLTAHSSRLHGIDDENKLQQDKKFAQVCKIKKYECDFCPQKFFGSIKLREHLMIHTRGKSYTCSVCKCVFSRLDTLNVHMRCHTGEKPFKCNLCNMAFTHRYTMDTHIRSRGHISRKSIQAISSEFLQRKSAYISNNESHRRFKAVHNLNTHLFIHTEEKSLKCNICNKCFSTKSSLVVHGRIHTGEKPYECSYCSVKFSYSFQRRRHAKMCSEQNLNKLTIINSLGSAKIPKEERSRQWASFIKLFNTKIFKFEVST